MAYIRDTTERKQMQEQLTVTDRLASVGELASGIAHELNNPLTSVIGFSELLLDKDIPDDTKKDIEVIHQEAQRAAEIVKNLLTFARKHTPARQPVNINSIIHKVLELRAYEQKVSNIQVNTRFVPNLPEVMADYFQLQQVFLNIIINAEQEMTTTHHGGRLLIKTEKTGNNIKVSIADNGSGISKEDLAKIFDPFFTTREVGDGTGLGLSICHGIITAHEGKIYAESEWGKGATFIVELPVATDNKQTEAVKVAEKEPSQQNSARTLIVDDEKAILDFLQRFLTEEGYKVETIDRSEVALDRLHSESYDLILRILSYRS